MDVIFSHAVLHWVLDHDRLFDSFAQALRPGGKLVAKCAGAGALTYTLAAALAVAGQSRFASYFRFWRMPWVLATPDETERRLRASGLEDAEVSLGPELMKFPSRQAFRDYLATVVLRPFLAVLPAELRPVFVEALVDARPRYELDAVWLNIGARKPR